MVAPGEQRSGTREPLFVRLVGPFQDVLLYSLPETWGVFDLADLPDVPPERCRKKGVAANA